FLLGQLVFFISRATSRKNLVMRFIHVTSNFVKDTLQSILFPDDLNGNCNSYKTFSFQSVQLKKYSSWWNNFYYHIPHRLKLPFFAFYHLPCKTLYHTMKKVSISLKM